MFEYVYLPIGCGVLFSTFGSSFDGCCVKASCDGGGGVWCLGLFAVSLLVGFASFWAGAFLTAAAAVLVEGVVVDDGCTGGECEWIFNVDDKVSRFLRK